ncbi:hypothetical protein EC843_104161 [Buttiauxella sp. JUb87]|jgi:hypothetical protein|nr:hypothetical protein EC843_104161 [Buttiauxella sp. JUb87]
MAGFLLSDLSVFVIIWKISEIPQGQLMTISAQHCCENKMLGD